MDPLGRFFSKGWTARILMPGALRRVALDLTPADEARDRALRRVRARLVRGRIRVKVKRSCEGKG